MVRHPEIGVPGGFKHKHSIRTNTVLPVANGTGQRPPVGGNVLAESLQDYKIIPGAARLGES
jgi:hypothetical protein